MSLNKNKKKYIIAFIAFIACSLMVVFAVKAQKIYANNTSKQEAAQVAKNKATANKSKETKSVKDTKEVKKDTDNASKSASASTANSTASTETSKANESKSVESSSTNSSANSSSKNEEAVAASVKVKPDDPEENFSIQLIDTVDGNNIFLKKNLDNMDGETVGYITEKLLDEAGIKYKCTGSASTVYFAAINGLEEKKAGKLSGWCYYVRKKGSNKFEKPNVGSGQWVYHTGDIVVWKYLADGIHDGYSDDWM